jgi:hypothetical protein
MRFVAIQAALVYRGASPCPFFRHPDYVLQAVRPQLMRFTKNTRPRVLRTGAQARWSLHTLQSPGKPWIHFHTTLGSQRRDSVAVECVRPAAAVVLWREGCCGSKHRHGPSAPEQGTHVDALSRREAPHLHYCCISVLAGSTAAGVHCCWQGSLFHQQAFVCVAASWSAAHAAVSCATAIRWL